MNERVVLGAMLCLFLLCEKVEGRGAWVDESEGRGDVVVTIFEITILAVLVACCVGLFQQYDAWEYVGWNGYGPCPTAPPPPSVSTDGVCGSVRITMDDIRRVVSREVKQELRKESARAQLSTVLEDNNYAEL